MPAHADPVGPEPTITTSRLWLHVGWRLSDVMRGPVPC